MAVVPSSAFPPLTSNFSKNNNHSHQTTQQMPSCNDASKPAGKSSSFEDSSLQTSLVERRQANKSFKSVLGGGGSNIVNPQRKVGEFRNKKAAFFLEEEQEKLNDVFKFAIVGKLSKPIKMQYIRGFLSRLNLSAPYDLIWLDPRHVAIKLTSELDYKRIWEREAWFFDGVKLKPTKWTPDFHPDKESTIAPVWVSFPNLGLQYMEKSALFNIAKTLGTPLQMDERTALGNRSSLARACIEWDVKQEVPDGIWIVVCDSHGEVKKHTFQEVCFEFIPSYCDFCFTMGHCKEECYFNPKSGNKPRTSRLPRRTLEEERQGMNKGNQLEKNVKEKMKDAMKMVNEVRPNEEGFVMVAKKKSRDPKDEILWKPRPNPSPEFLARNKVENTTISQFASSNSYDALKSVENDIEEEGTMKEANEEGMIVHREGKEPMKDDKESEGRDMDKLQKAIDKARKGIVISPTTEEVRPSNIEEQKKEGTIAKGEIALDKERGPCMLGKKNEEQMVQTVDGNPKPHQSFNDNLCVSSKISSARSPKSNSLDSNALDDLVLRIAKMRGEDLPLVTREESLEVHPPGLVRTKSLDDLVESTKDNVKKDVMISKSKVPNLRTLND